MNNMKVTLPDRLVSLDLFRGLTMFLLIAETTFLYDVLLKLMPAGTFGHGLVEQFHHHPWNGLRFWDLVQPYFMFIVGVAMVFSVASRQAQGDSWNRITFHMVRRSIVLLLLGVGLHCGYNQRLVWELWNVLTQLAFTTLIAFAIIRFSMMRQLLISFIILLIYESLFRFWSVAGYDQPFVMDHNFGTWMDQLLMGKINPGGGWITINFISTAAHTIWGVLAGMVLRSEKTALQKLRILVIAGMVGLVIGYGLDWSGVTPIIKRICTTSFVIVSGGWCLLTLALFYWLVDMRRIRKGVWIFIIVGMNPIFIYIFGQTLGMAWFNGFVAIFTHGVFGWFAIPETGLELLNSLVVLALEWSLCYWLYQRRIFFKI